MIQIDKPLFYDESEILNLYKENLRFAFHVESKDGGETKNDPSYVKMLARLWRATNGVATEQVLDLHPCTDEDLSKFAPPTPEAKTLLDQIQKSD